MSKRTASQAALEMQLHLNKPYEKNWKQPLTICLSAIGGAVVATLITFLIMRKKRGALAPAPAMAGIPAGEVSAGSDGDASAAPAAPESPAPPESSTPPEAAATDGKGPEETSPPEG